MRCHCLIGRMRGIGRDGCQCVQHPPLPYHLNRLQCTAQDRASPSHQLIESLPVPLREPITPTDNCIKKYICNNSVKKSP